MAALFSRISRPTTRYCAYLLRIDEQRCSDTLFFNFVPQARVIIAEDVLMLKHVNLLYTSLSTLSSSLLVCFGSVLHYLSHLTAVFWMVQHTACHCSASAPPSLTVPSQIDRLEQGIATCTQSGRRCGVSRMGSVHFAKGLLTF